MMLVKVIIQTQQIYQQSLRWELFLLIVLAKILLLEQV